MRNPFSKTYNQEELDMFDFLGVIKFFERLKFNTNRAQKNLRRACVDGQLCTLPCAVQQVSSGVKPTWLAA